MGLGVRLQVSVNVAERVPVAVILIDSVREGVSVGGGVAVGEVEPVVVDEAVCVRVDDGEGVQVRVGV